MTARAMTAAERAGMSEEFLSRTEAGRFSPLAGPNQPLTLDVQPETGDERMWYALGYDGAQTFEAVPLQFRSFYDLGAADRKANRAPRATWKQEKAVLPADAGPPPAAAMTPAAEVSPEAQQPSSAPVWPLLLGGAALTVGLGLWTVARRTKKARKNV